MKLLGPGKSPHDAHNLATWVSEGGKWRFAIDPTITGSARIHIWHTEYGSQCYMTEWCLGHDPLTVRVMTDLARLAMESFPEEQDPAELERLLRREYEHTTAPDGFGGTKLCRPINHDPALVRKLCKLAGKDDEFTEMVVKVLDDRKEYA
jgi:hypothetical protein